MNFTFVFFNSINNNDFTAEKNLEMEPHSTILDLEECIKEIGFDFFFPTGSNFARDSDDDWLWVLQDKDKRDIFICYFNGVILPVVNENMDLSLWVKSLSDPRLYFEYYKRKKLRAKYLYTKYNGNTFQMHIDQVDDEYDLYNVDKYTEEKWLQEKKLIASQHNNLIHITREAKKEKKNLYKFFSFLTLVFKVFICMFIGVWFALLPYNDDVYKYINHLNTSLIDIASLLLGFLFIILGILVIFLAIKDKEL